jgi:putative SOS response-associated peptidase YedK
MYFKISNTADRQEIERESNALFKYPNLYTPQVLINGEEEVSCPIITMEERQELSWAIWGLLPSDYQEDWELFQNINNTLNINIDLLETDLWFTESLKNRRCVIPVTGFFTTLLRNGEIFPYYISCKTSKTFFLAGIYTVLDDGFITFSILTGPIDNHLKKYQNLVNQMPIILDDVNKEEWLNENIEPSRAMDIIETPRVCKLSVNPIAKELFNQGISYESMLLPFDYLES